MSIGRKKKVHSADVIVIGGGPAGMMAAGRAAERGKRVILVEKNGELGKKLSITGGGRCNITNAEYDRRTLLSHFGDADKFLHAPFARFGVEDTFHFFEQRGLPLVVEARKRAFPETQRAPDVTRVMREYNTRQHVTIHRASAVTELVSENGRITSAHTKDAVYQGGAYVLATGGYSRPETGSSGEAFSLLGSLGYTVHEPSPDIVPLVVADEWVKQCAGTTLSFMKITFRLMHDLQKKKVTRTGKLLFTHFGLSGPLILNAAREVRTLLYEGEVVATIDCFPDTELGTLRTRVLAVFDQNKNKYLKNVLPEVVPAGLTEAVLSLVPPEMRTKRINEITREERQQLTDLLKALPTRVTGTLGYEKAVVSDGGVDLREVDTRTMRSRLHDNLYLIGDVLHISRPSGGYSLQLCWTTGYVAGDNA